MANSVVAMFEDTLQDQADLFDSLRPQMTERWKQFPIAHIMSVIAGSEGLQTEEARGMAIEWAQENIIPLVEEQILLATDESLNTANKWLDILKPGEIGDGNTNAGEIAP